MKYRNSLKTLFMNDLTEDATAYLLEVWDTIQLFDDIADGDKPEIERKSLNSIILNSVIGTQNNFFIENQHLLRPVLALQIMKWQASDKAEKSGQADEKSYMWRAGYYELALMVYMICNGYEKTTERSQEILNMYGETFKEYKEEFNHA